LGTDLNLLDDSLKTVMYPGDHQFPDFPEVQGQQKKTPITVVYGDCLETAFELVDQGLNPAVLNMANATNPGTGSHLYILPTWWLYPPL